MTDKSLNGERRRAGLVVIGVEVAEFNFFQFPQFCRAAAKLVLLNTQKCKNKSGNNYNERSTQALKSAIPRFKL